MLWDFLKKEEKRVTSYSIESDGIFIYTDSSNWCDCHGSGTFRGDTPKEAIANFYKRVRKAGSQ